jgi:hypothetical protein
MRPAVDVRKASNAANPQPDDLDNPLRRISATDGMVR